MCLSAATGIAPNDCHFIELALKIQLEFVSYHHLIIHLFSADEAVKLFTWSQTTVHSLEQ